MKALRRLLVQFSGEEADHRLLALFRIGFGLLTIIFAWNSYSLYPLHEDILLDRFPDSIASAGFIHSLQLTWAIIGMLMVVGLTNRLLFTGHFVLVYYLCVTIQIEHQLYCCATF